MKNFRLFLLLISFFSVPICSVRAQAVSTQLTHSDSVELTIFRVLPDSFPSMTMIFKAETVAGDPLWNLDRSQLTVTENGQPCEILSLTPISKNQPISLALVVDHSGSMAFDQGLLFDSYGNPKFRVSLFTGDLILPKNYVAPIENARAAIKKFAHAFDFRKDYISMIGFSTRVDKVLPRTRNVDSVNYFINSLQADGLTALYDAMMAGLNELNEESAVNVLITLTDGQNNRSSTTWREVVAEAQKKEVPLYIIGVGDVNADTLKMMANSTGGQFYYTRHSSSLDSIYTSLQKKIQAFYSVTYNSPNLSSSDTLRESVLYFSVGEEHTASAKHAVTLPPTVVQHLRTAEQRRHNLSVGGGVTLIIVSFVAFMIIRRKRNERSSIQNVRSV
jgi:Ca-activated chloride channel family protein